VKLRKSRKLISILLTLSFLACMLVPMAGVASAQSVNAVSRVLAISDTYTGPAAQITLKESSDFPNQFTAGQTFRLTLTPGVKWDAASIVTATMGPAGVGVALSPGVDYFIRSDNTVEITMPAAVGACTTGVDIITFDLGIDANGTTGDITVTVDPIDSTVTGGTYTFAVVKGGKTTAVAESVEKIGQTGTGGIIRIDETAVGAIAGAQTVTLKLPSNFEWDAAMTAADITLAGDFLPAVAPVAITAGTGAGFQSLTFTFTPKVARTARGTIYINPQIKAKSGAAFGDIEVSISSPNDVDDADLVVAQYVDWGVTTSVKSVKELTSGKLADTTTDTIKIEENIARTLINGRSLTITLPDWVKVTGRSWTAPTGDLAGTLAPPVASGGAIDGTSNEFDIRMAVGAGSAGKLQFKLDLSIEANKTGDIEAVISGAGIEKQTLVIAKAVAPVAAKIDSVNEIKLGVQAQDVADIYITENIKKAIQSTHNATTAATRPGYVTLTLPNGVKFAATPKVEVTEGNLTIKDEYKLTTDDTVLSIPIDSQGTKASTIKVSGVKVTVDRTYPEGAINAKIGGSGIVENFYTLGAGYRGGAALGAAGNNDVDAGEFLTGTAVKLKVAECVTPAPQDYKGISVFKIGEATFTQNGIEKTMDVAPYIKNDRTFMPLRFVANAAGVADSNIMWNPVDQSVVLIKGDRVVKLAIGSTNLLINGIAMPMDVAPEIVDPGRTMMPLRAVAQALGCEVLWDADTQSVTVQ